MIINGFKFQVSVRCIVGFNVFFAIMAQNSPSNDQGQLITTIRYIISNVIIVLIVSELKFCETIICSDDIKMILAVVERKKRATSIGPPLLSG